MQVYIVVDFREGRGEILAVFKEEEEACEHAAKLSNEEANLGTYENWCDYFYAENTEDIYIQEHAVL